MNRFLLFLIVFVQVTRQAPGKKDDLSTLRFVNVVFRHGDRSSGMTYPNNPIKVEDWLPQQTSGWLTENGAKHEYELGEYARKRYDGFLSESYFYHEVKIWSSDVHRTIMSGNMFMRGLYNDSKELKWQLPPVRTVGKKENDDLLQQSKPCPLKEKLMYSFIQDSDEAKELLKKYENEFDFIKNKTGFPRVNVFTMFMTVDALLCQEAAGFPMPDWYTGRYKEALLAANDLSMIGLGGPSVEMRRLAGGPLLKLFTETLKKKGSEKDNEEKFYIYSGHDISVVTLLMSMDIYDGKRPGFSSAVFVELHETQSGKLAVQVLYKFDQKSEAVPITKRIRGCTSNLCPFEIFVSGVEDGIPKDWDRECEAGVSKTESTDNSMSDVFHR